MNDTLKFTKPMMHGPAVVRLQEFLGCEPIDGIYGTITEKAVRAFQRKHDLPVDGICGTLTWSCVMRIQDVSTSSIIDIRENHPKPKLYGYLRSWDSIDGVTLHQTGCSMPRDPINWGRVNAHFGITQEGIPIFLNDPTEMIWHAQFLSRSTIGIEIEGNYYGVDGDDNTLWSGGGGPHKLNLDMEIASDIIFDVIKSLFELHCVEWKYIYAHRQACKSRAGDPGEEIWKKIAKTWIQRLKCKSVARYHFGTGRPIPTCWSADGIGNYWEKKEE